MSSSRRFGLWTLIALVVGNAVGAGIYTTSGFSLADLGAREWVLLAWLIGGLVALCGAVSYGLLAGRLQESGGEYLYLHRSIHPVAGFIAGWISLVAGFPGAIAFAATALEAYMRSASSVVAQLPTDLLAISVVIAAGGIHITHVKVGAKVHEYVVSVMLVVLLLILAWGAYHLATQEALLSEASAALPPLNLLALANSLVWISLSYSGFNAAAYVAGEVIDPERNVMRGMVIGTLLTLLLCLAVNAIILYAAPSDALRGQAQIATVAAESIAGRNGRMIVELVIALSLLTSITAMAMAGPRVYAKMAEDGALPGVFRATASQPPRAAIILQVIVSVSLILLADLRDLLSYLGLTLSLCLALAVSSLFVRHWRFNERPNSGWYPWAPAIFVSFTALFATLTAIHDSKQFIAVLPTIGIGVLAWLVSQCNTSRTISHNR